MTNQKNNSLIFDPKFRYKYNQSSLIIQSVRKLFLSGGKYTAKEINSLCHTNDARKIISKLCNNEGWEIVDCRLPNGCKLYWLSEKGNKMHNSDFKLYYKSLNPLSHKDFIKANIAVMDYIFLGKEPCSKTMSKDLFLRLRPMLNIWRAKFLILKEKKS